MPSRTVAVVGLASKYLFCGPV